VRTVQLKLTRLNVIFWVIVVAALTFSMTLNVSNATSEDVIDFVNSISKRTLTIANEEQTSESSKEKELEALFKQVVDTRWIGKFSLGRYWRSASNEQRAKYLNLYSKFLTQNYVPNFKEYAGSELIIQNVSEIRRNEYLVQTLITENSGSITVRIDYRLKKKGGGAKDFIVFDIIAEGVSLITTQRSEFSSIIARSGMDYLISMLENKVSKRN
jgi:phospholipid transport system substrate-binding protein